MIKNYYILRNSERTGPFTFTEMMQMDIDLDTQLQRESNQKWQNASELPEFNYYFEGKGFYFPTEDNLAGFWWRLLAYAIDSVILTVAIMFFASDLFMEIYKNQQANDTSYDALITRLKLNFILFLTSIIYNALLEATPMRGSIGKRICKLAVVDADGKRLSLPRAFLRNVGKILSSLVFCVGYLNILWDDHRQAWHDYFAKTYVIIRNR
ncbi:RDD family protein [Mucilaginibacter segetis]|uniref:RDD family protein n=1 Tax=Mucilaginibacter segetis TaxID=2793071 RepID=A0A934PRH2_9SPHI|nr:RDD family protein [Mucilaginibacter segetis]MBK0377690.1 RDD family protein [Mucilaginibacter segetis]